MTEAPPKKKITNADLVKVYIKMRTRKAEIAKQAKADIEEVEKQMEQVEGILHRALNDAGVNSMGSSEGTFYKEEIMKPSCGDWMVLYDWIKKNDAFHFLEKRVTKTAVQEYLEEHGELPPGINVLREQVVRVRAK